MAMKINVAEAVIKMTVDQAGLKKELGSAKAEATSVAGGIQKSLNMITFATVATAAMQFGRTMMNVGRDIIGFVNNVANFNGQLYDMEQRSGIAATTLAQLDYVAKLTGGDIQSLSVGMKFLTNKIYDASQGSAEAVKSFRNIGIEFANRQTIDIFMELADKIKNTADATRAAGLAMDFLGGRSGESAIPVLKLGSAELQKLFERFRDLNPLTQEAIEQADRYTDAIVDMKTAWQGLKQELLGGVIPALTKVMDLMTQAAIDRRKHPAGWSNPFVTNIQGRNPQVLAGPYGGMIPSRPAMTSGGMGNWGNIKTSISSPDMSWADEIAAMKEMQAGNTPFSFESSLFGGLNQRGGFTGNMGLSGRGRASGLIGGAATGSPLGGTQFGSPDVVASTWRKAMTDVKSYTMDMQQTFVAASLSIENTWANMLQRMLMGTNNVALTFRNIIWNPMTGVIAERASDYLYQGAESIVQSAKDDFRNNGVSRK